MPRYIVGLSRCTSVEIEAPTARAATAFVSQPEVLEGYILDGKREAIGGRDTRVHPARRIRRRSASISRAEEMRG